MRKISDEATKRRSDEGKSLRAHASCHSLRRFVAPSLRRSAFSLVELLVVIGLIVVIMALALPAFNFITGTRSVDGAANVVSAFLGRARAEALAAQRPTGVFFYIDPVTERRAMALVQATDAREPDVFRAGFDVWLDLLDSEPTLLPGGIDVQTISDGSRSTTPSQKGDRYLGFNRQGRYWSETGPGSNVKSDLATAYGGVILFDGAGRLMSATYGFRGLVNTSNGSNTGVQTSRLGSLLFGLPYDPKGSVYPVNAAPCRDFTPTRPVSSNEVPPRSALGLVLLQADLFKNKEVAGDPQIISPTAAAAYTSGGEAAEEAWIDENATPMLINRYNGTLVKGQ